MSVAPWLIEPLALTAQTFATNEIASGLLQKPEPRAAAMPNTPTTRVDVWIEKSGGAALACRHYF
jgi:hypothetical protein